MHFYAPCNHRAFVVAAVAAVAVAAAVVVFVLCKLATELEMENSSQHGRNLTNTLRTFIGPRLDTSLACTHKRTHRFTYTHRYIYGREKGIKDY